MSARSPAHRTLALAGCLAALAGCAVTTGQARRGTVARAERHPPVVVVAFDEFSTTSLVDAHGHIDAGRYPNFAALARDGNWFPYATASSDETGRSMGALLTGSRPTPGTPPTSAAHPRSLFTLLGRSYAIHSSEEVTSICPRRLCPGVRLQNSHSVRHELAHERPQRFARWARGVRPSRRPTLFFKHVLFPHAPWSYLPDGRQYHGGSIPDWAHAFSVPWVAVQKYQRHLLQLSYTDHLLGTLLARLKRNGLYDRAMIVVTADNGEGFGQVGNGHEVSSRNVGDIALTPLIVKAPFQHDGRVIGRHVRTVDVLPTIARTTNTPLRWRVQGRPVYGPAARKIPATATVFQRSGRRFRLSLGRLRHWARSAQLRKAHLFGAGLFAVGPYQKLLRTRPSKWPAASPSGARATLFSGAAYRSVRLRAQIVPRYVTGRLSGRRVPPAVGVALNGQIVATSPTYRVHGRGPYYFSAMLPDTALREGRNDVRLYAVGGPAGAPRIRPIGP